MPGPLLLRKVTALCSPVSGLLHSKGARNIQMWFGDVQTAQPGDFFPSQGCWNQHNLPAPTLMQQNPQLPLTRVETTDTENLAAWGSLLRITPTPRPCKDPVLLPSPWSQEPRITQFYHSPCCTAWSQSGAWDNGQWCFWMFFRSYQRFWSQHKYWQAHISLWFETGLMQLRRAALPAMSALYHRAHQPSQASIWSKENELWNVFSTFKPNHHGTA